MENERKAECIRDLNLLWDRFVTVRAAFPYFRSDDIGKTQKKSASFYRAQGKRLTLTFPAPLRSVDIESLNALGYWVNQSLVVWMWSLLEYHKVVGKSIRLDHSRPGFQDVNVLHRLRKIFAHTDGRYNPSKADERKLFEVMIELYHMNTIDRARFNLQINEVLKPMFSGVIAYVEASDRSRVTN